MVTHPTGCQLGGLLLDAFLNRILRISAPSFEGRHDISIHIGEHVRFSFSD